MSDFPAVVGPLALGALSNEKLSEIVAKIIPKDAQPNEKIIVLDINEKGEQFVASFKMRPIANKPDLLVELQAVQQHQWTGEDSVAGRVILRWK